jgi:spoIIIJ-associated protein
MTPEAITTIIREFLDKLAVSYERVEFFEGQGRLRQFLIESPDSHLLIGKSGAGLDALNHLLRQMVRRQIGESAERVDFTVDVNRYRTRRTEELIRAAEAFAERARLFHREIEMPAASAFERMVVHAYFADDTEVMTESVGEGKFRHVVIKKRQIANFKMQNEGANPVP